jgi:hypothetical protein
VQILAGDTITGVTSAATARVLVAPYGITGTWGGGDAAGTLVLVAVTGTFLDNEVLNVAATPHAIVNGTIEENVGPTADLEDTWAEAAQDYMRSLISDMPGIRAGARRLRVQRRRLCLPRQPGATQGRMWKSTAAGWVQQTFGKLIRFVSAWSRLPRARPSPAPRRAQPRSSSGSSSRTGSGGRPLRRPRPSATSSSRARSATSRSARR